MKSYSVTLPIDHLNFKPTFSLFLCTGSFFCPKQHSLASFYGKKEFELHLFKGPAFRLTSKTKKFWQQPSSRDANPPTLDHEAVLSCWAITPGLYKFGTRKVFSSVMMQLIIGLKILYKREVILLNWPLRKRTLRTGRRRLNQRQRARHLRF